MSDRKWKWTWRVGSTVIFFCLASALVHYGGLGALLVGILLAAWSFVDDRERERLG
jgi:hypothetical protein